MKFVHVIIGLSILFILLLVLSWILFSPFFLEIDTRIPRAMIHWFSIGKAWIWYDEEWWVDIRVLFFRKKMRLSDFAGEKKKAKDEVKKKKGKRKKSAFTNFSKIIRLIRTFRIREWQAAIDTGDFSRNARLYPLNFYPYCYRHVQINFSGENFLYIKIENSPWRIVHAFLR